MVQDVAGVILFKVHQNGSDDLRVFVTDEIGDGRRIKPLQPFNAVGVSSLKNAGDEVCGLVVARALVRTERT